jgi:VWFA-related protein
VPSPTPPVDNEDDVIRIETNLVTLPVSVLDRNGRFISGLLQRDFRVFENGVEQQIGYFQSLEQPFTVALMIDVSPSTAFQIEDIQNAAIAFIEQLRPDDRVIVIAFDQRVQILARATNDKNVLRNAIRQTRIGNGTSLYAAVDQVILRELAPFQGRKAIVLFTDGVDTTSRRTTFESSLRNAEEADALIYPVRYDTLRDYGARSGGVYRGPGTRQTTIGGILGVILGGGNVQIGRGGGGGAAGTSAAEYARGRQYLETLAQNSGGRSFEADSLYNLEAAFSGIAEELRRQYSIGYYPESVGQPGERRRITIRVNRPNVVVRARNSYVVGSKDSQFAGR